ncbi:MAG: S8 family serine peptidase [Pyrinomonadaceae bacterium]
MSHVSSHHPSRPRLHKKQSNSIIRRRFTLVLCLLAVVMLPLALRLRAAGAQSVDPADAFSAKADKLLQRVYHAANVDSGTATTESRTQAAREQLLDEPLTGELGQLSQIVSLEPLANGDVKVDLTVRLAADVDESELRAAGFATGARIGNIVTVEAPADRLPELAALSSVRKMQAGVYRYPLNDRARRDVGIDNASGQRVVGQTGSGVVVGIIDTGIDFRHGDFRKADGTTRIKALWDMSRAPGDYVLPGTTSSPLGHAYTEADINAALVGDATAVLEKDLNGHGTHVAGTAAGNGLGGTAPGTYAGMAPEADLVIVKATRSTTSSARFDTNDTINALKFIQQQAAALNEPFVINMSLGGQLGPHDGTGNDEIAIDNLVNGGAGRAVCVAAGNEGSDGVHASTTIQAGGSIIINFHLFPSSSTQFIDLYNRNSDKYRVTVTRPDGTTTLGPVAFVSSGSQASDQYLEIDNSTDPQNGQPDIFLIFKKDAPAGDWKITLQDADSNSNGAFDAWAQGDGNSVDHTQFLNFVDNNSHLVGSPGTARGAITVGAYVTRTAGNINIPSLVVGNYAYFTSSGPTADGRQKPEISAPGYYIYSSRSSSLPPPPADPTRPDSIFAYGTGSNAVANEDRAHYGGLAGTSMATPVTAGSVALLLQANRSLSNDQIKSLLTGNASHDGFDPAGWNSHFGFGKLNIAAALNAAGVPTATPTPTPTPTPVYSIAGRVTNDLVPISGAFITLSGTQAGAVQTDTNGNYSFANLTSGGNYTVSVSKANYVFNAPQSLTFSDLSANQTANFTGTVRSYTISGRITDVNSNIVQGIYVAVTVNGAAAGVIPVDANGNYTLSGTSGSTYTLTPSKAGYVFFLPSQTVSNLSANVTLGNFTALNATQLDDTTFFVEQHYKDFLARGSDPGGLAYWSGLINQCNGDAQCIDGQRVSVSAAFFIEQEFQESGNYVYRLYKGTLNRRPIFTEFNADRSQVVGGTGLAASKQALADAWVARPEFTQKYGQNPTPDQLVDALIASIKTTTGNTVDLSSQRQTYLSELQSGASRGQVVRELIEQQAFQQAEFNRAFVLMQYFGYLRRDPDQGGYDFWLGILTNKLPNDSSGYRAMVKAFMTSIEYRARFPR